MNFNKIYLFVICSCLTIALAGFLFYKDFTCNHSSLSKSIIEPVVDRFRSTEEREHLHNFQQELARLAKNFSNKQSIEPSDTEYSAKEYGDFSKMLSIVRHSFTLSKQMHMALTQAVEPLKGILKPPQVCTQEGILQSKKFVNNFRDALDNYEKKYNEEVLFLKSQLQQAFSKTEYLKSALDAFETSEITSTKLVSEYLIIERDAVQLFHDILDFMSLKIGSFEESNGILIFKSDEDLKIYTSLTCKLNEITKKEAEILKKIDDNLQLALQPLKDYDRDSK